MGNPTYSTFSSETQGSDALTQLALDLHWSWNHSADDIWRHLDPELWELTGNPWLILQAVSQQKLDALSDPAFRKRVEQLLAERNEQKATVRWFQKAHPNSPLQTVAYFSMEYMLSEALPIYSGGLGNVAGDQLKSASNLGVPVIAVGLLYQQGYFRQEIDSRGEQLELYPVNEPGQLPIRPVRKPDGEWLRMRIALPGGNIWIRTWQVDVGLATLYLMDTNDPANPPQHRGITSELYGGGPELRLKQEMLLGIAGWRLLRELGIPVNVCHLNEGHAAFALLERARSYMKDTGRSFYEALAVTRTGNVFTTHTAVDAGFDRFAPELIRQYLSMYAQEMLKISVRDFLALGRIHASDDSEPFNMAYLAIRGSGSVNGVSRLHGKVSRRLFQPLFQRFPDGEVPVGHVTNGVHMPAWDSERADRLWMDLCGKGTWSGDLENTEKCIRAADDSRLWDMRTASRKSLVEYTRERLLRQIAGRGASPLQLQASRAVLNGDTLTLGFARRFATYKRPTLLLQDPDRLARILTNPQKPVQLVLAGKAHPKDMPGQELIHAWISFVKRPDVRNHVVFLTDYDMLLAERLVEGVDVWINTPRRPWEACGTSGMKVLVNGGLNLSVLDGWWAEAYSPAVGWAIGNGNEHGDDPAWDWADAEELYSLLENEIVPEFYDRDEKGIPRAWVARIRESMAVLTPAFSANRTVRQYTEEHYLPAAAAYAARVDDNGAVGASLASWQREIAKYWDNVQFGELTITTRDSGMNFDVELCLGGLDPAMVSVQLYADPISGDVPFRQEMHRSEIDPDDSGTYVYTTWIPATRPAADFTPRAMPFHLMAGPLEIDRIVWQR
jgi:glycogen phosphorylase